MSTKIARILVVDDDQRKRDLLRAILGSRGYAVTEARDGEEGLMMARQERPDLIIVDLIMPNMDGRTFCTELHKDPTFAHIPVAACSGMDLDEIKSIAKACKIEYVIPYMPKLLRKHAVLVVEAALAKKPEPLQLDLSQFVTPLEHALKKLEELSAKLPGS
jgi:CheY-like chemotaxis protein